MTSNLSTSHEHPSAPSRRLLAAVFLGLLLFSASFGTWIGLWRLPGQPLGRCLYFFAKVWLVGLPIVWRLLIERRPLSYSPPRHGGLLVGVVLGLGMSLLVWLAYVVLGTRLLDVDTFVRMGRANGFSVWYVYLSGAVFWITVNSLLEEMVWRWFVVERLEEIGLRSSALWCSALGFTIHHIVALRVYCSWSATLLCALGIFAAGAIWSALYRRYRSVWPGYLSHALVDVTVFVIGWWLIRGA